MNEDNEDNEINKCKTCRAYNNGCTIKLFKIRDYSKCPCQLCLIKSMCTERCDIRKNYYNEYFNLNRKDKYWNA